MVRASPASSDRLQKPRPERGAERAPKQLIHSLLALAFLGGSLACEPKLNAGDLACPTDAAAPPAATQTDPIVVPWSTGFENQFCDYAQATGYCYGDAHASLDIVTAPVHSGRYAAAFTVNADDPVALQTRCVRRGALPPSAYYEAWYFVPVNAAATENWNLWYFEGGHDEKSEKPLWNINLVRGANGGLVLVAFNLVDGGQGYPKNRTVPVPIGSWFHIEFFLERAVDATGRAALYQDDVLLFDETQIVTDTPSSSLFGQWYVGNLAGVRGLTPPDSTIYVDDVSISASR